VAASESPGAIGRQRGDSLSGVLAGGGIMDAMGSALATDLTAGCWATPKLRRQSASVQLRQSAG